MCYPKLYLSRVYRCLSIIVFFNIATTSIAQTDTYQPITKAEVIEFKKQVKEYKLNNEWASSEPAVLKIIEYYKSENVFDSVYIYNELLSLVGKNTGNLNIEMQGYLDRISQDQMFSKRNKESYETNISFVSENLDTNRLTSKMLSQGYETISSYLFDNNYIDSSIVLGKKSIIAADKSDVQIVKITTRLRHGLKLQYVNRYEEKLNLLLEAEKIADKVESEPIFRFRIYKDIGLLLLKTNDLEKAEFYIEKAIGTAEDAGYSLFGADAKVLKARLLGKKKEFTLSNEYFDKAIDKYKEVKYLRRLSVVYVHQAFMQLDAGSYEDAKVNLDYSLNYTKDKSLFYECTMAKYNLVKGNLQDVRSFLDRFKDNSALQDNFNDVYLSIEYLYFKKKNNFERALLVHEKFISTRDSIRSRNKDLKIHRIESEYNREKQDVEIKTLNKLNVAQDKALAVKNTALWMGSIMLLVLGGLLFGLYRLYKRDQDNQNELALQNKQISKALAQNQVLIKEIHHRVKNNLQVVSSLLSMQARKVTDGDTKDALNSSKTRVQSMSILHQNLYQGNDITGVNIEEYLEKLVENIVDTYHIRDNIKINIDIDPISLDVDTLVPLGLVANELICNALKYAFEGRDKGVLSVSFKTDESKMTLRVADDGVGFSGDELPMKKGSLGARLIKSFSERLEGEIKIDKSNGTDISIVFDKENF